MAYVHHLVIHFPIAFVSLAALVALVAVVRRDPARGREAAALLALATLAAVVAAGSGLLSAGHFIDGGGDAGKVALHRNLALGAAALTLVASVFAWRASRTGSGPSAVVAAASVVAAVVVSVGAHLGGDLVHPGLAPWSAQPHSHGAPAAGGAAADDHHGGQTGGDHHGGQPGTGDHHGASETDASDATLDAGAAAPGSDAASADSGRAAPVGVDAAPPAAATGGHGPNAPPHKH
ncbi:MAG: hypothetical protein JST00_06835 [Deltaproteobacteria bacterium]|nr:hypothetical protein [Deltaproteobacteria bacterium]